MPMAYSSDPNQLQLGSPNSNDLAKSQPQINYGSNMDLEVKDEFDIFEFLNQNGDQKAQIQFVEEAIEYFNQKRI